MTQLDEDVKPVIQKLEKMEKDLGEQIIRIMDKGDDRRMRALEREV